MNHYVRSRAYSDVDVLLARGRTGTTRRDLTCSTLDIPEGTDGTARMLPAQQ